MESEALRSGPRTEPRDIIGKKEIVENADMVSYDRDCLRAR